ncbi:DNA-binding protein [Paenibacillus albilobatus]|uniref:DNA-binding protein n=1 Tax=Paenibacillus albilobatus TaxID=2716884 RepID=A0A919XI23_9BACL|nr:hypothetical protein [Paenibacillus albilobatus]GIO33276.1 DNA-binding protein [Paenibacillus albilobatus]
MLKNPPLVVDNTVISVYGKSNQFTLLESLYAGNIIIPTEVITEAIVIPSLEAQIKRALGNGWLQEHRINYVDHPNQLKNFARLRKRFGDGESAVMAIAKDQNCTVGSDDLRATHKYCRTNSIPMLGSLGILYDSYDRDHIDEQEGQAILTDMLSKGYRCPVKKFNEILEWFQNGKGRELF